MTLEIQKEYQELLKLSSLYIESVYPSNYRLPTSKIFYEDMLAWHQDTPYLEEDRSKNLPPLPKLINPPQIEKTSPLDPKKTVDSPPEKEEIPLEKKDEGSTFLHIKENKKSPTIVLEDIRKHFHQLFPHIPILENPSDDALARRIGNKWKQRAKDPEVILLSCNESHQEQSFLSNISKAIDKNLSPAMLCSALNIDKQEAWKKMFSLSSLKLILVPKKTMQSLPKLREFYGKSTQTQESYLGSVPVLILEDLSAYFNNPKLKLELWNTLNQKLKS